MGAYIPPGWPAGVHPPGSEDFESTAVGWLLDVVPPDYRLHGVLRRYPVALATMARYHSKACVEGARQGYRTARTELAGALPPHAIDTVLAAYRKEGARLAATAEAVDLVERALRGEVFTPKMSLPSAEPRGEEPESAEPRERGRRRRSSGRSGLRRNSRQRQRPRAKNGRAERSGGRTAGRSEAGGRTAGRSEAGGRTAGGAKAARAKAAGQKAGRAKGEAAERGGRAGTADQGRAGARRYSAGRGRSDLART